MNRSKYPTPYILIRASSSFESEECDFALIHFTGDDLEDMRAYVVSAKLAQASATNNFCSVNYYVSVVGYYMYNEVLPAEKLAEILGADAFAFVETDDDEIEALQSTAAVVTDERLEVYPNEEFGYVGRWKGAEIVFKTSIIKLAALEAYFPWQ